ncbi:CBS domain-containing protein [Desulfurispora thermophila]|uniref:CBS domain-containing protein n=1 Tax=Desulfurispora thermophila TaxID=265470 RepID=UPI00037EB848|nr:CBS domain-containing protein [Desulfurispora thermophila]
MKVKDRMVRDVVTINANASIKEALTLMQKKGLRRLPVLENGRLVGVIVEHDIEKVLTRPGGYPETPVSWAMSYKYIFTAGPEDDIKTAARLMLDKKISCLPVVENGRLVGIITETDLLNAFIELCSAHGV